MAEAMLQGHPMKTILYTTIICCYVAAGGWHLGLREWKSSAAAFLLAILNALFYWGKP